MNDQFVAVENVDVDDLHMLHIVVTRKKRISKKVNKDFWPGDLLRIGDNRFYLYFQSYHMLLFV